MMHPNKAAPAFRSEVKSKIGDYIRGKISAQSLMHPSRINTKPLDRRQYALNAPATLSYNDLIKPEYQKKARRPPLKDYIEGKVKLSDMISPSRITHIPKERKYQPEVKNYPTIVDNSIKKQISDASVAQQHFNNSVKFSNENISCSRQTSIKFPIQEWSLTTFQEPTLDANQPKTELTLIPIKTLNGHTRSQRRRKVMCKIKKVQRTNNGTTTTEEVTEERIIEVPESLLRERQNVPKFLMDRYNIPCCVNGVKAVVNKRKRPLAIANNENNVEGEEKSMSQQIQSNSQTLIPQVTAAVAEDEDEAVGEYSLVVDTREAQKSSGDINLPTEQGDYNSTTYIFEFYEEPMPPSNRSAIIEEINDENAHRSDESKTNDSFSRDTGMPEATYEDYKSQIYLQRELLDLHRNMLKCDKNVMVVEHSVNQVTASLNTIETIQNQEIKPVVMNMKNEYDHIKTQVEALQNQNEKLKTTVKCLRKKTTDYEKLMQYINENSTTKIQELESKLQTITQAQVKSIEMQNVVNKNIFKITHQIKRTYSEMDSSRHCPSSIMKSQKNSNSSVIL